MSDAALIVTVVIVVVLLLAALIVSKSAYIVSQAEGIVIERFGKFRKILPSGLNWIFPGVDEPKSFTWRRTFIDVNGRIKDTVDSNYRIDLRESVFNFPRLEVWTKDTVLLDIDSLMYYSIVDIMAAVYEVPDLPQAISTAAQTQLKEVFGNMTFTEALTSQQQINTHMREAFGNMFAKWGIHVERMEVMDISPKGGTAGAMKKQMIAERDRRGEFIRAEGKKSAMRLKSEGTKIVKYNLGVAEQEATRKRSEGEAGAKVELVRAEAKALELVADALAADHATQTEYMISQSYISMLRGMSASIDDRTLFLPYATRGLSGLVGGLSSVFGARPSRPPASSGAAAAAPRRSAPAVDAFDALS